MKKINTLIIVALCVLTTSANSQQATRHLWTSNSKRTSSANTNRTWMPLKYNNVMLDVTAFKKSLSSAPFERTAEAKSKSFIIELPSPDGNFQSYRIEETFVMHPDLAKAFPLIKTFTGQGISDASATIRLDYNQFGVHAFIRSPKYCIYIDPVDINTDNEYLVYYRSDVGFSPSLNCLVEEISDQNTIESLKKQFGNSTSQIGGIISDYRLAMGCTGEYGQYYGGTVAGALAGIVTTVNRVDGVYETELGISLTLIPNDTLIIYTDPLTDGYTNSSPGALLSENQQKCSNIIGGANYDIGHVVSTAGGGLAALGVVCNTTEKAKGETGLNDPIGDPFDIDYVAHEIGHQFGGNHTFNSTTGSCGGNGNSSTAYEPGSGITIMAYAGICGSDNLDNHSIPYFHTASFDEIIIYSLSGNGSTCPVFSTSGNNEPSINAIGSWIIPYKTPFKLTATATDPDNDTLYYSWEQFDLGPGGAWNTPSGNAPIYRPYSPDTSGTRLFPKLNYILTNTTGKGELLPTYARTLHFRCTARDNRHDGGGVTYNDPPVSVQCINTGVGFAVTSPNTTGISWINNSQETITWNVAQSDVAPINTPNVNILLSTDGGNTFPVVLASNIPNNGSAIITVPNSLSSSTCRVWIEGAGNVFFDINDKDFAIQPASIDEVFLNNSLSIYPNPANDILNISINTNLKGTVLLKIFDNSGRLVKSTEMNAKKSQFNVDISDLTKGFYLLQIENEGVQINKKITKL